MKRTIIRIIGSLFVMILLLFILKITTLSSFRISSYSMMPTLHPGDCVLVNKLVVGGRFVKNSSGTFSVYRLPTFGKISINDVLVFNYQYPNRKDSIGFCPSQFYVKRCFALPGDTFTIQNCINKVYGYEESVGIQDEQIQLSIILSDSIMTNKLNVRLKAYPRKDTMFNWTVKDFGPMWIPAKGKRILLNECNLSLYRMPIEWEIGKSLEDTLIREYTFCHDYYFMGGDNCIDSQDSRYWGVVPDDFVVGKVFLIWKSAEPESRKIRWNRLFKKVT